MRIKSNVFRGIVAIAVGLFVLPACLFLQYALVAGLQVARREILRASLAWSIWCIFAITAALIVFWWTTPKPVPGHCLTCGYNLTGNVSGRCPECGEPV